MVFRSPVINIHDWRDFEALLLNQISQTSIKIPVFTNTNEGNACRRAISTSPAEIIIKDDNLRINAVE